MKAWPSCLLASLLATAPVLAGGKPDAAEVAAAIDRHVAAKLRAEGVPPAPPADDATFFRRVNLTLAGRIPEPADARAFLADPDPDKRVKAIDRLLASPAFIDRMTVTWRNWLIPEAATDDQVAANAPAFEAWLKVRVRANDPLDRLVTDLLTAPLDNRAMYRQQQREGEDDPNAANGVVAFYAAKEAKPENLAAVTARTFLGVQLECAQCHDHPFSRWSRDQFWGLAAFFAGIRRADGGLREDLDRRDLLIPNTDRTVPATFLDDKVPEWRYKKSPRVTLAAWVTAPDNPFFARAAANRLWGLLFGVGLVDPVDDFHDQNPPSHPELLDELAKALIDSGFDSQFLIRAICLSETFNRASAGLPTRQDARLFARFPVQGMTVDQFADSLAVIVGPPAVKPAEGQPQAAVPQIRRQLPEVIPQAGRATDAPTSIVQALALMNGPLVGGATALGQCRALAAAVDPPNLSPAERVEALYLAALSRPPRPEELRRALRHVEAGGSDAAKDRYADVLWALLSGVEFRTNH